MDAESSITLTTGRTTPAITDSTRSSGSELKLERHEGKAEDAQVPDDGQNEPAKEEDTEENKNPKEADLTDGEELDTEIGQFNAHQYFADFWLRRKALDSRRNDRDKQRRQYSRYMINLDDRLNYLEDEILRFAKAGGLKEDPDADKQAAQPAMPEIKPMTWNEYEAEKGKVVPSIHYAIDMLVEEPVILGGSSATYLGGESTKGPPLKQSEGPNAKVFGPRLNSMPERIRINASKLREAVLKIAERGTLEETGDYPIIMRRPFKFLLMHEEQIRSLLFQEEEALQNDSNDSQSEQNTLVPYETSSGPPNEVKAEVSNNTSITDKNGSKTETTKDSAQDSEKISKANLVKYLKLLISFIEDYVKPTKQRVSSQDRVSFDELYSLFAPGELVYVAKNNEQPQKIWRVIQVTGGNRFLRPYDPFDEDELVFRSARKDTHSEVAIDCYSLAFDGLHFRPVYKRFSIPVFADVQSVKSLSIIPYDTAKRLNTFREDLMLYRSQQFLECTKACHRHYRGRTVEKDSQGRALRISGEGKLEKQVFAENIDGNVMVDVEKAFQHNPSWMPDFKELGDYKVNPREWEPSKHKKMERVQPDLAIDTRRKEDYLEQEARTGKTERWEKGQVEENDMLLLPDRVPAYFLRSRKWVFLQLGYDGEGEGRKEFLFKVEPNAAAWNDLQLPGEHKIGGHRNIVQSLVDKHFAKDMDLDLVRDKGRGLIVLLHGAPGVGKTSTAECVAEAKGKPLLPITCGDLGLQPENVEANLSKHFELAQSWDCILLLDESDVFLAERSLKDLNRNALVSVFLRILEYYEGILFLTTNKVGLIDEAFKSRIHMALYYPWLDEYQTESIWKTFIRRARLAQKNLEITEREIIDFAMEHMQKQVGSKYGRGPDGKAPGWNGRQIKNAFMSAIALAQYEAKIETLTSGATGQPRVILTRAHFNTVAHASDQFDEYLWKVHSFNSAAKLAEKSKTRYDIFQSNVPGSMPEPNVAHHASSSTSQSYHGPGRPVTSAQQQTNAQQMRANHQPQGLGHQYGQIVTQPQMGSPQPMTHGTYHAQGLSQQPMLHFQVQPQPQLQSAQQYLPQQQTPQFQQLQHLQVQGMQIPAQSNSQEPQKFTLEQGHEASLPNMEQQQSFQQQGEHTQVAPQWPH